MGYCSNYLNGGRSMMRGGMFGMGFLLWVLLALVIVGVVYLLRNRSNQQVGSLTSSQQETPQQSGHPSALELLDEEFARGTITEEEYLHKKEVLKK